MTITKPSGGVQQTEKLMTGTQAVAQAVRLADVDVMAAYPIRPYDGVMQAVAKLIANGELDAEYIVAEGEHSQFEICKHASAVGSRVFVGSSGVGWMYAMESLAVTPPLRLPVVAMIGNRALDDPGAFGVEHNDAMCVRDLGWQLVWVEDAQECFDATLLAYRIGEDKRVSFPVGLCVDGAFITHSQALVKIPDQESVDAFLPPYDLGDRLLHPDNPISIAPQANEDWVMEIRKQTDEAARRVKDVIREAHADFRELFGRGGDNPFFEEYRTEDADYVLLGMGSLGLPAKVMVRRLRDRGEKVGFIRLKWFRPFPDVELAERSGPLRGRGRSRPRLLLRFADSGRCSLHRPARGPLQRRAAAPHGQLHRGPGRSRAYPRDDGRDGVHHQEGRRRRGCARRQLDRGARVE